MSNGDSTLAWLDRLPFFVAHIPIIILVQIPIFWLNVHIFFECLIWWTSVLFSVVKIPQHFWSRAEGEVAQDERPAEVFRQTGLGPCRALDIWLRSGWRLPRGTNLGISGFSGFCWTWICSCIATPKACQWFLFNQLPGSAKLRIEDLIFRSPILDAAFKSFANKEQAPRSSWF